MNVLSVFKKLKKSDTKNTENIDVIKNNKKSFMKKEISKAKDTKKKISIVVEALIGIIVFISLLIITVVLFALFVGGNYKKEKERVEFTPVKPEKSNIVNNINKPTTNQVNQKTKFNKIKPYIKNKKDKKEIKVIENNYDVFKNFYIEKYQSEISQKIAERYIKQLQACYKEKQQLQNKFQKPKVLKDIIKPMPKIKINAIYCTNTCYAITNLGLIKSGQKIKGRKVIITPEGVRFK